MECPVRLDLSGGWTDTPPICYEHGGTVLNVAITINGQRPIGARARLVESPSAPSVTFILKGEQENEDRIYLLHTLEQFTDYNQPQRACALLKSCCILTGIVDIDTAREITLEEQLKENLSGQSLILEAWSNVPVGSGLGTSSILAGAILLALWHLIGMENISDSMIIRKFSCVWSEYDGTRMSRWSLGRRTNDDNRWRMARSDRRLAASVQTGNIQSSIAIGSELAPAEREDDVGHDQRKLLG